jgi:hypothetical protein
VSAESGTWPDYTDRDGYDGGTFNTLNPDFDHLQGDACHQGLQVEEEWKRDYRAAEAIEWESRGEQSAEAAIWTRGKQAGWD